MSRRSKPLDFTADPEIVRVVAEGSGLAFAHLFNPAFATEISMIDPLPHQRIAVYDHMLPQPRLRFLLGDEPGAGKTIMAGLYIREMLARRLLRRVLIVPPAGLVGNWERELRTLFGLDFRIVVGADARSGNPFTGPRQRPGYHQRRYARQRTPVRPAPGTRRRALRPLHLRRVPQARRRPPARLHDPQDRPLPGRRGARGHPGRRPPLVARLGRHHLLLLTATPHMGKDFPYYALWRLLEPEVLSTVDAFNAYPADAPPPSLRPPHQGGDGQLRRQAHLPEPRQRHPQLRPLSGRDQRADPLRQDDRLHRPLLQPRPHPQPLGGPARHVGLPAPAGELDLRPPSLLRASAGETRRAHRVDQGRQDHRRTQLAAMQRKLDDDRGHLRGRDRR